MNRLLRHSPEFDLTYVVPTGHPSEQEKQGLVARINDASSEYLIEHCLRTPFSEVFWHLECSTLKHEVLGKNDSSGSLCLQRDSVACLLAGLAFLVVVSMNPNIWNVIIEDFAHLVHDSSGQLGRDFC